MTNQDPVRINGKLFSWASTSFKIGSEPLTGITEVTYDDKIDPVLAYGMNRSHAPIGMTQGKYTPSPLKLTVHRHTAEFIREQFAASSKSGKSTGTTKKDFTIQSIEEDQPTQTVEAIGCRLVADAGSHKEAPDAETEEMTFQPLHYKRNGKTLFEEKR